MKKKYSTPHILVIDIEPDDLVATSDTTRNTPAIDYEWTDDSEQLARKRGGDPIWD